MKRILGQTVSLVALVATGSLLTPACADDDGSIFVQNNLAPPTSRQNGVCTYQPDATQPFISQGTVDVGVTDHYEVNLLVANQMIPRGDANFGRAESNRVHIEGAVVRVTDSKGAEINSFTAVTSGFLNPGSTGAPSYGIAAFNALDAGTVAKLGLVKGSNPKLVIANIKVFGKTLGGVDVETGEFAYPIQACYGCLVSYFTGDDPASAGVDCNVPLSSGSTSSSTLVQQVVPCIAGQDESIPCQLCTEKPACNNQ